ncbi:solute carrier family 25 member 36-A-like isoform X2 [Babylonia areolata]|uniref:solute carrier family 25 member 36-A-like isoform X2 n=1 Tax=Babylonia areolata TaxID=304850 RepID=UPI003FD35977
MEANRGNVIHIIAGGAGGTAGAVLTCPLEVVKTRLQSSGGTALNHLYINRAKLHLPFQPPVAQFHLCTSCNTNIPVERPLPVLHHAPSRTAGVLFCLRHILQTEGPRGLFKGIGPNLVGVAPSRAIYFGAYAKSKRTLNEIMTPNTPLVHLCSAIVAGVSAATCTNPIWLVKTRLQLDNKTTDRLTCRECIRNIYQRDGLRGFYRGLSASYYGVSETVLHLVIYEAVKGQLLQKHGAGGGGGGGGGAQGKDEMQATDFFKFMLAGAISKSFATCVAYPCEVARTRLREEGSKYRSFFQTLNLVVQEEGGRGVYRGLTTQLIRQIPNTAIVMATYETVVYLLSHFRDQR